MRRIPGRALVPLWSVIVLFAVGPGTAIAAGAPLVYAGGTAAEAARDRARALSARLTRGLGEGDSRPGSVVAANLSPEPR